MLYFAYGSNLNWTQMRKRCPSARFVCTAKLPGHRLGFTRKSVKRKCGVADAVREEGSAIWGIVYQIDETDLGRLDESEGYSPGHSRNSYMREERRVFEGGDTDDPTNAWVYFAVPQEGSHRPNAEYKKLIVEGAMFWHLPDEYIRKLEGIEVQP